MDLPDFASSKSPRRELQGPRPAPLKVRKDSHKIRKPPVAPPQLHPQQPQAAPPPRGPVIIYTVSPKVIHANPNEFMNLVQRLTGPDSRYPSSSSTSLHQGQQQSGAISPAARFASIEKAKSPEGKKSSQLVCDHMEMVEGVETSNNFPGILSPNPNSLPPIPSNLFDTPTDQNPLNFFTDLSPVLHSNKNYLEGSSLLPSPSTFMISPNTHQSLDLFNNFFDL